MQTYSPLPRAWKIKKRVLLGHICCHVPGMRQYLRGSEQTGKRHLRQGAVVCQQLHQLHTAVNVRGMAFLEKISSLGDFFDGFRCSRGRLSCQRPSLQTCCVLLLGCSRPSPVSMSNAEVGATHLAPLSWTSS